MIVSLPVGPTRNTGHVSCSSDPLPSAVFDGLNVMCGGGAATPRLEILLDAMLRFLGDGYDVMCISDATTRHKLGEYQGAGTKEIYDSLLRRFPKHFGECPARRKADPFVLSEANARDALVVSSDLFRDYARQFSWIENDPDRFVKISAFRDHYYIDEARFPIPTDLSGLVRKLGPMISQIGLAA